MALIDPAMKARDHEFPDPSSLSYF